MCRPRMRSAWPATQHALLISINLDSRHSLGASKVLELLSPCFPSNSNVEDVRAVLRRTNVVLFGHHQVMIRLADGNATPAKIIPYGASIQELIIPEAKDRFGSYKKGQPWTSRPEEDVEWSINFIRVALDKKKSNELSAGFVTTIIHNAFTDEPPVRKELKPLLKGFLSQPMDLDEPFPLSAPADPAAAASTESNVTNSGVRVREEPNERTAWKRSLRSMSASTVIDLDEPSPKKTKEGDIQDVKILTVEEETAAMMAADSKMPTLSQELDQLIKLCDDDTNELKNLAETKN
eukprot:3784880-Amphidinium_carterae.1